MLHKEIVRQRESFELVLRRIQELTPVDLTLSAVKMVWFGHCARPSQGGGGIFSLPMVILPATAASSEEAGGTAGSGNASTAVHPPTPSPTPTAVKGGEG
jgi:hypothetical protein